MFWKYFIGITILSSAIYVGYLFMYKKYFINLSEMLYLKGNPKKYLEDIDKFPSTIFFHKKLREMMKIDAYIMIDDEESLEKLFDFLNNTRLRNADEFIVHQKQVTFYSSKNNLPKVKEAYEKMLKVKETLSSKTNTYDATIKECEYIIAILEKDGKFAKELARKGNEYEETMIAGSYYYKAAQSYYFQKDEQNAKYYLEKAQKLLRGTNYEKKIEEILKTNNLKGLES